MSDAIINLSLAPGFWARLQRDELLELGRQLDASAVTSIALIDPDTTDAPGPWRWDSSTAVGALLAATRRIGLVVSVSAAYTEPFSAARRVGSLAHLANGRVAWLLDTSSSPARDRRTRAVSPDLGVHDPVERAAELVSVSWALWDSWEDGALRLDIAANQFVDESRVRPVAFSGKHFRFTGQINLPRPPGGSPALYVRVARQDDVALASAVADVVLAASPAWAEAVSAESRRTRPASPPLILAAAAPGELPGSLAASHDIAITSSAEFDSALRWINAALPTTAGQPASLRAALTLPQR